MTKHRNAAKEQAQLLEAECSKERKRRRQIQADLVELKAKVANHARADAKLKDWEDRRARINHYLKLFPVIVKYVLCSFCPFRY